MSFTADSTRVDVVLPQPNHSGYAGKPCAFGIHDIECPPGDKYRSLAGPDYLQNPAEQHSVQYVRIGKWRAQGVPETQWAWGMGTPASKHTTHEEQAGYASFSRAQWLGDASAIGTTYQRPNGTTSTYTADDATFMADQLDGLAGDYADWCKRWGYTPKLGTMDELARTCQGEELGIAFTHAMASRLPNTSTHHTDPGENYPLDVFIAKATAIFNPAVTPPTPTPAPPTPGDFVMDAEAKAAFTALNQRIDGLTTVSKHVESMTGAVGDRTLHLVDMVASVGKVVNSIGTQLGGAAAAVVKAVSK